MAFTYYVYILTNRNNTVLYTGVTKFEAAGGPALPAL